MEFVRTPRRKNTVNLTSLIDIIFLLVVFFLLTSEFVVTESVDLNISTVKSEKSGESDKNQKPILVVLTKGDKFIYSGKKYDLSLLQEIIGDEIQKDKGKSIIVTNKKGSSVQSLVTAMDSIKSAGGYNISIVEGSG